MICSMMKNDLVQLRQERRISMHKNTMKNFRGVLECSRYETSHFPHLYCAVSKHLKGLWRFCIVWQRKQTIAGLPTNDRNSILTASYIISILAMCNVLPHQTVRPPSYYLVRSTAMFCRSGMYGSMPFILSSILAVDFSVEGTKYLY